MKALLPLVSLASAVALAMNTASAVVIENFESYSEGQNLGTGTDWNYAGTGSIKATPDGGGSGYTFVMSGSRSAYVGSGLASLDFSDFGSLSWGNSDTVTYSSLVAIPDSLGTGKFLKFFLSPNSGGGEGAGLWLYNDGTGAKFWNSNASTLTDTGVSVSTGGGGAPTLSQVYRISVAVNFSNNTFENFYEDVTNNPGTTVSLGGLGVNLFGGSGFSGTDYLNNGNLRFSASGAAAGLDNIEISVVPEPQSIALLAISGLLLLMGCRKRFSGSPDPQRP